MEVSRGIEGHFEIVASMERFRGLPDPETPFRILIMGDFSGCANRGIFDPCAALAQRLTHLADRVAEQSNIHR